MVRTEDLIGSTRKPGKISGEEFAALITEEVNKPYEQPEAISRCFCRRCGLHGEILEEYLWSLIKTAAATKHPLYVSWKNLQDLREYYFVINRCEVCQQEGERVTKVEIKRI